MAQSVGREDLLAHMKGLYPDMQPDVILRNLRAAHDPAIEVSDLEEIFVDFLRPKSTLTGPQRRLAEQLYHPTFLDLPAYFGEARRLRSLHTILGFRDISLLDDGPKYINLYFRLQPLRVQREIVQSDAFRKASPEDRDAVLVSELNARVTGIEHLKAGIIRAAATDSPKMQRQTREVLQAFRQGRGIFSGIAAAAQVVVSNARQADTTKPILSGFDRPDYFQRLSDGIAIKTGEPLPDEPRVFARRVAETLNQPLGNDEIAALQNFPHVRAEEALDLTVSINEWLNERGQNIHIAPPAIFDTLQGITHKGEQHDPLFLAWVHKLALIQAADGRMVETSLEDVWRAHVKPKDKPVDERLIVQILRHAEFSFNRNPSAPMHITLESLAKAAGLTTHQLNSTIFAKSTDEQQRFCWRARKGEWHAQDIIKGLARVFHPETDQRPELFFAQPAPLPLPAVVSAPAAPPVPPPAPSLPELPKTPWEERGLAEAGKLFGAQFQTPDAMVDAVIALMQPQKAEEKEIREKLFGALREPQGAVRTYIYGDEDNKKTIHLPSIPHMWLMWVARPETHKYPSSEDVFTSLAVTFGLDLRDDILDRNLTETPQGTLAWAALEHARGRVPAERPQNGVSTITSYRDFLRWSGSTEQRENKLRHQLTDLFGYMDELRSETGWPTQMNVTQRDGYYKPMAELLRSVVVSAFGRQGNEPKYTALLGPQRRNQMLARLQPLLTPEA